MTAKKGDNNMEMALAIREKEKATALMKR